MVTGARTAMNMFTPPMNTSDATLTLVQLLSPSFPVGGFAYSHGLETAIDEGFIANAQDLQDWLHCLLTQGGARADATLLTLAYVADDQDLANIDAHARAFAASKERLQETDLQGAAFCETVTAVWDIPLSNLTYPVAVGRAARALALDPDLTAAMYLHAFVGNLCGAAMRLVPLGQTDGQRVQTALKPLATQIAAGLKGVTLDDLHSNSFMSDIVAMRHETQYSRVFRT
jgi:urease accessory protein